MDKEIEPRLRNRVLVTIKKKKKKLHIAGTAFDVKKLNARASSQFLCATLAVPQNKWKRYLRALTTEEQLTGETQNCVCPVSPPASRGLPPRQDSEKKMGQNSAHAHEKKSQRNR